MDNKYREIMDKVVVTDEMRERIEANIKSADPDLMRDRYEMGEDEEFASAFSDSKIRKFPRARLLAGIAAACLIVLAGTLASRIRMGASDSADTVYMMEEATEAAGEAAEEDTQTAEGTAEDAAPSEMVGSAGPAESPENGENAANATDSYDAGAAADADLNDSVSFEETDGQDKGVSESESARAAKPITLGEPEIRKIIENYIGEEFEIFDLSEEGDILIYTVREIGKDETDCSYIRIDRKNGEVQVTDAVTGEQEDLYFDDIKDKKP